MQGPIVSPSRRATLARRVAVAAALGALSFCLWLLFRTPAEVPVPMERADVRPRPAFPLLPDARPPAATGAGIAEAPSDRSALAPERPTAPSPQTPPQAPVDEAALDFDWEVTVLGTGDRPLAGVRVEAALPGEPWKPDPAKSAVVTGADGIARLHGEFEGTPQVLLSGAVPETQVALQVRSTVVRMPALLPVEVRFVDGTTGAEIAGASASPRRQRAEPTPLRGPGEPGGRDLPLVRAGVMENLFLEVALPAGYAPMRAPQHVSATISRYAERARADLVAWPEARVRLRVQEADGAPVAGAGLYLATCARWVLEPGEAVSDAAGDLPVRGLPCIPGEIARVAVRLGDRAAGTSFEVPSPGVERVATVTLPREPIAPTEVGIGGGAGGMFGGRKGGRATLRTGGEVGKVAVEVRRRNGAPAAEAKVVLAQQEQPRREARTGADGIATFASVAVGEATVSLEEPGLLAAPVRAEVAAGRTTTVLLAEEDGAASDVLVRQADGSPAPGAVLRVTCSSGLPYVRMEGTVQVLTHHTGPDGRCALPGLPPGAFTVHATLGSRTASATGEAGVPLEIELPPAR